MSKKKEDVLKLNELQRSKLLNEILLKSIYNKSEFERNLKNQKYQKVIEIIGVFLSGVVVLAIPIYFIFAGLMNMLPIGFQNSLIEVALILASMIITLFGAWGFHNIVEASKMENNLRKKETDNK